MKKHLRIALLTCLALCMTVCLAIFAVACNPDNSPKTFTITVVDGDNNPVAEQEIGVCQADGACTNLKTDNDGKIVVNTSTDAWKNSANMHIQFLKLAAGVKGFDADGFIYDSNDGPYVDHHKTNSATLTVKTLTASINVDVGIEQDERGFGGKPIVYALNADSNSKLMLDGNTNGGEFAVRAYINGEARPEKATFNATTTSKTYDIPEGGVGKNKIPVLLIVQPANENSSRFTFNTYSVYELNYTTISVSTSMLDGNLSYKTYFNLTEDTSKIAFGHINDNLAEAVRYPVTVKIGSEAPITWNSSSDILPEYVINEKGFVPIEFSWADTVDDPFIGIIVSNSGNGGGDDPSDNVLTLGTPVTITSANYDDIKTYTFVVPEAGLYVLTYNVADGWAQYEFGAYQSGLYDLVSTAAKLSFTIGSNDSNAPFEAGNEITFHFASNLETELTFTVTLTKAA